MHSVSDETGLLERCSSGLRGTPGKRVYPKRVSGVRISLSPQSKDYQEVASQKRCVSVSGRSRQELALVRPRPETEKAALRPRNFLIIFTLQGPLRQGAGDVTHEVRQISPSGKEMSHAQSAANLPETLSKVNNHLISLFRVYYIDYSLIN